MKTPPREENSPSEFRTAHRISKEPKTGNEKSKEVEGNESEKESAIEPQN